MRRWVSLLLLFVLGAASVGFVAPPAVAGPRGHTRTAIAGAWEGSPPVFPTSIDPDTGKFTVVGHAVWSGDWVGVSIFHMKGTINLATGDYVATAETEFQGTWLDGDNNSRGALKWREKMRGNFITGVFVGTFDILEGSGDPAFGCSSGHFTWAGYAGPAASYGGYQGTWIHGCPLRGRRR
ncbi:MAG TPA: hypothetical protein VNC78_01900 [Actinomycetota bacterium]|nr:hypothetical protein [Actinomycetota bacterium]